MTEPLETSRPQIGSDPALPDAAKWKTALEDVHHRAVDRGVLNAETDAACDLVRLYQSVVG